MSAPVFGLHFRRYAPFEKFGIPSFKGDGRHQPRPLCKPPAAPTDASCSINLAFDIVLGALPEVRTQTLCCTF